VIHLVVLANLAIFAVGLAAAGGLFRHQSVRPSPAGFWRLAHFLALTFTMAAAVLDAYLLVNLGFAPFASRLCSSLVLLGTAAMTFSFPLWSRAMIGFPRRGRTAAFWGVAAGLAALCALAVFFLEDLRLAALLIALSFLPFAASVVYGLILQRGSSEVWPREAWIAFFGFSLVAAAEVAWILTRQDLRGHFFVTLPLAYLYVSIGAWRGRDKPGLAGELPEALAREAGLTQREIAMARGILAGRSNKELAADLGISENTVRNHVYNLYRKLGIQKRLDLVVLVRKYGAP